MLGNGIQESIGHDRHLFKEKTEHFKNDTYFNVNLASVLHCFIILRVPLYIICILKSLLLFTFAVVLVLA
jgi:hypothetical protein